MNEEKIPKNLRNAENMKKSKQPCQPKRPGKAGLVIVSLLLVLLLLINFVCIVIVPGIVPPVVSIVSAFLSSRITVGESTQTVSAASAAITQEVESEGIVLLENNGTLPIQEGSAINLFGYATNEVMYGGSGSGSGDSTNNVDLVHGLENAGFQVNQELVSFYQKRAVARDNSGFLGNDYSINEIARSEYSDDLIQNAKNFSDIAVVSFSRAGGEGDDLPMDMTNYTGGDAGKHYLTLQQIEIDLLNMVKENFGSVIVLINSSNAMELGFLEDESIDAALWVGFPGATGCNAIGDVLKGSVNPSGRLTDTYAYDITSAPSYYSFGAYDYTNVNYTKTEPYHYVEYIEGIYVGYRYYETRYINNNTGECDEAAYADVVQYPFGYGRSYTTFTQEIVDFKADGTTITMDVKVTNTGNAAGKEVVQVYFTAPYTIGGIEKSHVVLVGFGKTRLLVPGEPDTITISFLYEDMASYDFGGIKAVGGGYVLEAGTYEIKLQSDAHNVIDSREVEVSGDIIYTANKDGARSTDLIPAVNLFDDVSYGVDLTYVSRADWEDTMPTERAPQSKEATEATINALTNIVYEVNNADEPIVFAEHGLKLSDMKGLDYDDPQWDLLLEQLSVDDMVTLVTQGGWSSAQIDSVGKPFCAESDGPAGVHNLMTNVSGTQITSAVILGSTWNVDLARRMGEAFGDEALAYHVSGLYAPGMNIHRSPFSGRNFEYISEDGLLTGKICAAEVQGIQSKGVYCYSKHYAVNDQETNRNTGGLLTWANEQAMREVYFKGFEIAVKEGKTQGIMSSFNRLGAIWTAASHSLITTVLREEWGFVGAVVTDAAVGNAYMNPNTMLRAGNDLLLTVLNPGMDAATTNTNTGHQLMRRASHNILYMVANSAADEVARNTNPYWLYLLAVVDIALFALIVRYYVRRHKRAKVWKTSQAQ